jgi:hypothetical protein
MVRDLTADEVEFVLECRPEYAAIEGNASAIDDETDAASGVWIRDQLCNGNQWAWCSVCVIARWHSFQGMDTLGCCSYESEEAFKNGGYYEDVKAQALADLNEQIAAAAKELEELEER